ADHYAGLPEIFKSETNASKLKRLFMHPRRVYHNGIIKRPSKIAGKSVSERDLLGPTRETADGLMLTGLKTDLLKVKDSDMNTPFIAWKKALAAYRERGSITFRRLAFGD